MAQGDVDLFSSYIKINVNPQSFVVQFVIAFALPNGSAALARYYIKVLFSYDTRMIYIHYIYMYNWSMIIQRVLYTYYYNTV